jgi:hypothetical protein
VLGLAPGPTENPPDRVPPKIEHDDEVKRPPGDAARRHVVPAKFEPEAMTPCPTGPKIGLKVKFDVSGTLNDALPVSPVVPVTVTVYGPLAPDATVNDPDRAPPATVHSGFEMRTGEEGEVEIAQPESPAAKFEPEMRTGVPAGPEAGSNDIPGETVKPPVPTSPASPVRVKT